MVDIIPVSQINIINYKSTFTSTDVEKKDICEVFTLAPVDVCNVNYYKNITDSFNEKSCKNQKNSKDDLEKNNLDKTIKDPIALKIVQGVKTGVGLTPIIVDGATIIHKSVSDVVSGKENLDLVGKFAKFIGLGSKTLKFTEKTTEILGPIADYTKKTGVKTILGSITIASGGYEIYKSLKEDDKNKKIIGIVKGSVSIVGGTASLLGEKKISTAASLFNLGLKIGDFGNNEVKRLGLLKDINGKSQSVSDRISQRMSDIHEDVKKKTGSNVLGHIASISSGIIMLPAGGVIAIGGAIIGTGTKTWTWIAK